MRALLHLTVLANISLGLAGCGTNTVTGQQRALADKGCFAGETMEQCEGRQRQEFIQQQPPQRAPSPTMSKEPMRFPEILHGLTGKGMSPAERVVVARCKQQAEAVYNLALATQPIGSYKPDILATGRLRDCMIAEAPGR